MSGGDHRWFKRSTGKKRPVTRDIHIYYNNNNITAVTAAAATTTMMLEGVEVLSVHLLD